MTSRARRPASRRIWPAQPDRHGATYIAAFIYTRSASDVQLASWLVRPCVAAGSADVGGGAEQKGGELLLHVRVVSRGHLPAARLSRTQLRLRPLRHVSATGRPIIGRCPRPRVVVNLDGRIRSARLCICASQQIDFYRRIKSGCCFNLRLRLPFTCHDF